MLVAPCLSRFRASASYLGCLWLALTSLSLAPEVVLASETGESGNDGHHDWHPNHIAMFLGGVTPVSSDNSTVFAIGIAYERRFSPLLGIEGLVDFGIGDHKRTALFAAGPTFRPFTLLAGSRGRDLLAPLKLGIGPGFEIVDKKGKTSVHFLVGVGTGYDIHLGKFTLTPTVYVDFIGETETNVTYGLYMGWGF